jgi:hypothetical protein
MRTRLFLVLGLIVFGAGAAMAEDMVLPVLALNWSGGGGTLWSTEVFATNPGPLPVALEIGPFLPGQTKVSTPCLPPVPFRHQLPPYSTQLLTAAELSFALGCPDYAIGGLVFSADAEVSLVARVANVAGMSTASNVGAAISKPDASTSGTTLRPRIHLAATSRTATIAGVGQQIPATPSSQLAGPGTIYQVPGLILDPNPCTAPGFESYLYIANPGPAKVSFTLQQSRDGKSAGSLVLSGKPVITPYTFTVPAGGWQQFSVQSGGSGAGACAPPQVMDLFFTTTGNLAVVGTVVDLGSHEPRTVLPLATTQ